MLAFKRAQPWQVLRVTALNEWMISSGDMSKTRVSATSWSQVSNAKKQMKAQGREKAYIFDMSSQMNQ